MLLNVRQKYFSTLQSGAKSVLHDSEKSKRDSQLFTANLHLNQS